jgi:hypothetical protein
VYSQDRRADERAAAKQPKSCLRRCFQFSVEVGNDVLEGRDRLLNRSDLYQFPAANRTVAVLQRDNQIPPLLLELNQRQAVVRQMSHHDVFQPLD